MQAPTHKIVLAGLVVTLASLACTPTLDWRDVQADGTALAAQMPCKPSIHQRAILLVGQSLTMTLKTCTAGDATWALAWVQGVPPAAVTEAMRQWREAAVSNVAGRGAELQDLNVHGATPNVMAGRSRVSGQRPDGSRLTQDLVQFVHGTTLFQATVLSSNPQMQAIDQFFSSLRLRT